MSEDFELTLFDRLEVIRTVINQYGEENFYIAFSGGKDSMILHNIIDIALPKNKIPRVYTNTGIEYSLMVKYVRTLAQNDPRIVIINSGVNIRKMLEEKGYPFKSKEHSLRVEHFNKGNNSNFIKKYMRLTDYTGPYVCPKSLMYQFEERGKYNYSNKCCYELKKKPAHKWAKENHKTIVITGLRQEEGGTRKNSKGCIVYNSTGGGIKSFKPLNPITDNFEQWFIQKYNIKLCDLYYPPYSFQRTGCKGCPYNLNLQHDLDKMATYLPAERQQCETLWKPIYDEYRRLNYRLTKNEQIKLF
ncbi:phosphoadenosine phosphosulfate reductase family protein [Mammaliicoccus vitulinus]|uniref:phosphoadenosine phosphosulfate reductase domain-containing protein n=1 Tax=Mammaliicoccus vitulinus TaxID=71237 RepID=UPI00248C8CDB|nr:phosphoadenosine phosphosulfate reductase family protein [Mammaliicoccus vitulinus]